MDIESLAATERLSPEPAIKKKRSAIQGLARRAAPSQEPAFTSGGGIGQVKWQWAADDLFDPVVDSLRLKRKHLIRPDRLTTRPTSGYKTMSSALLTSAGGRPYSTELLLLRWPRTFQGVDTTFASRTVEDRALEDGQRPEDEQVDIEEGRAVEPTGAPRDGRADPASTEDSPNQPNPDPTPESPGGPSSQWRDTSNDPLSIQAQETINKALRRWADQHLSLADVVARLPRLFRTNPRLQEKLSFRATGSGPKPQPAQRRVSSILTHYRFLRGPAK